MVCEWANQSSFWNCFKVVKLFKTTCQSFSNADKFMLPMTHGCFRWSNLPNYTLGWASQFCGSEHLEQFAVLSKQDSWVRLALSCQGARDPLRQQKLCVESSRRLSRKPNTSDCLEKAETSLPKPPSILAGWTKLQR